MKEASKVNPDEFVKKREVSNQTGLPVEAITPEFTKEFDLSNIDFSEMNKVNPKTGEFLSTYDNAVIAQDDIAILKGIERTFSGLGRTISLDFQEQIEGSLLRTTDKFKSFDYSSRLPASMRGMGLEFELEEDLNRRFGIESPEQLEKFKEDSITESLEQIKELRKERDDLTPEDLNYLQQGLRGAVQSIGNMAPGIIAAVASGGRALPALLSMGGQTYAQAYAQARAEGLDADTASQFATEQGAIEVITEIGPTALISKIARGGGIKEGLKSFIKQEFAGEQVATLAQSLNEYRYGLDEQLANADNVGDMVKIQAERQLVTAIATVFISGAQSTAAAGANKLLQTQAAKESAEEGQKVTIETLINLAQKSTTNKRDSETFKQFVNSVSDDASIYIDQVQLSLYLTGKDVRNDPALQLLADALTNSMASDADITISAAEFMSTVATSKHGLELAPLLSLNSELDNNFRAEESRKQTLSYAEKLISDDESRQVFETIKAELIDTGTVSKERANVMSEVASAYMVRYATDNGITVQEAYERTGLKVTGPQTGEAAKLAARRKTEITPEELQSRGFEQAVTPEDRRSEQAPVAEDQRTAERRKDDDRRSRVSAMTPEEQYVAIYLNELTGLLNRRAFNEDVKDSSVVVSIDVDSLKTVNDNLGQNSGDDLLRIAANAIAEKSGKKAYHISGDEFYVIGDNRQQIIEELEAAKELLKSAVVESDKGKLTGVAFTYGVADNKKDADDNMKKAKIDSEAAGTRAGRGELPAGMTLKQVFEQEARGYYDPAQSMIRLTEASDASTFFHEFAHFMYETEKNAGGNRITEIEAWFADNPELIKAEMEKNGYDENTAKHELFARSFETYVMEGTAPTRGLRDAFRSAAMWLMEVYRKVRGDLNVSLDSPLREIFDKLLVVKNSIDEAEVRMQYEALFTDATMAGMTPDEYKSYLDKQSGAKGKATETLRDKVIKQLTRKTQKWWKDEKALLVEDEKTRLEDEDPVYIAIDRLRTGDIKLDLSVVKEEYGIEKTNKFGTTYTTIPPKLKGMTLPGMEGMHPDVAAGFLGFNSGDEMIKLIMNSPGLLEKATQNAEAQMVEKHGDILNDGSLEKLADEALQNEKRGSLLLAELRQLDKKSGRQSIERNVVKQLARESIDKMSFSELTPSKYRNAEMRNAKASATALAKGDALAAQEAKQRQLINFYLGKYAIEAKQDVIKMTSFTARYGKKKVRENIIRVGEDYMGQIDKILARFELRKSMSMKELAEKNEAISSWMKNKIDNEGDGLIISPEAMNELYATHWKKVPYSELKGIVDTVKNIEHVARYADKIKLGNEEMDFKELVSSWVSHIGKGKFKPQRTSVVGKGEGDGKNWFRWSMAGMSKIPWIATWLDNGERVGLSHQVVMDQLNQASRVRAELWIEVGNKVINALNNRTKDQIKRHAKKYFISEIKNEDNDGNLMGSQIIAVALNTGNEGNLRKMLLGEGWAKEDDISYNNPKLQSVLKHMTKEDWDLVQLIWNSMEELYPKLAEVHKRTTGQEPPKVKATPVKNEFGEFRGGYYPVKYDSERSKRAEKNEEKRNAQVESMFGGSLSLQASVNTGAVEARTGYYAPMRLSLDVVPNHFQETIQFISHHDAVRQLNRLLQNDSVGKAISSKLGPDEFKQLRPWLNDVAKDGSALPIKNFIDQSFQRLRFGITLGTMGFKASTIMMQFLGVFTTMAEIGTGKTLDAYRRIFINGDESVHSALEFAIANSNMMGSRIKTMDREVKSAIDKVEGKSGALNAIQEASMKGIGYVQLYAVDLPAWHGAYAKVLEETGDEQKASKYADFVVESTQGSGAVKDLPAILRNQGEVFRSMTMFMTFFSALWNLTRDTARGAKTRSVTSTAAKAAMLFVIPFIVEQLVRGELFEEDEEPEEMMSRNLTKAALYPISSVPFFRDIASGALSGYGYSVSPVDSLLGNGIQSSKGLIEAMLTDKEITKSQVKGTSKLVGAVFGIPGIGQVWNTGEHVYEVIEEGNDPSVRELLLGPKR